MSAALGRPLLWLFADKGPAAPEQLRGQDTVALARHGCVSASVNFDALRAWAGWRQFLAPAVAEGRFGMYALVQGVPSGALGELREAWAGSAALNLPLGAERLLEHLIPVEPSLPQLLQALAFTRFDPDALLRLAGPLRERAGQPQPAGQVAALAAALEAVWQNHFLLAEPHDLPFELATILHRAGQLSAAARHYRHSLELRGGHPTTHFNLALCLLDLGQVAPARAELQRTLALDPAHARAKALLAATGQPTPQPG